MLNEIFKGMDNASEAINDNFLSGGVVEHNLNDGTLETGLYIRFGNGWQVCQKEIDLNQSVNQAIGALYRTETPMKVPFPKEFIDAPYVNGALHDGIIGWVVVSPAKTLDAWDPTRIYSAVNNQVATKMTLFASGRWK